MKKLTFPHEIEQKKILKYEKKVKLSPLTLFLQAIKANNLQIKIG